MGNRIVFITRTKKYKECYESLRKSGFFEKSEIEKFIIICGDKKDKGRRLDKKIEIISTKDPTSAIALNLAMEKLENKKYDYFLIVSNEIFKNPNNKKNLNNRKIETLIKQFKRYKKLLVVGYKFKINNKKLNKELDNYYKEKGMAYIVPWNTCALWNYDKFIKNVGKFDDICSRNPFPQLIVCINGEPMKTEYQGMEDGLAIAKAISKDPKTKYSLLEDRINWEVDEKKIIEHKKKMARKNTVLTCFMAIRDYATKDLKEGEIKDK